MEIKIADGIKVANQQTLKLKNYPGLSEWAGCHQRSLKVEEGARGEGQRRKCDCGEIHSDANQVRT